MGGTRARMTSTPTIGMTFPGGPLPQSALRVSLAAAAELADLASLFGDLIIADMADHHIDAPELQGTGFLYLRRACWEGSLIAYGRCFITGQGATGESRTRLNDFLPALPQTLRESHDRLLLLRDKRIGHHVAQQSGQP